MHWESSNPAWMCLLLCRCARIFFLSNWPKNVFLRLFSLKNLNKIFVFYLLHKLCFLFMGMTLVSLVYHIGFTWVSTAISVFPHGGCPRSLTRLVTFCLSCTEIKIIVFYMYLKKKYSSLCKTKNDFELLYSKRCFWWLKVREKENGI